MGDKRETMKVDSYQLRLRSINHKFAVCSVRGLLYYYNCDLVNCDYLTNSTHIY